MRQQGQQTRGGTVDTSRAGGIERDLLRYGRKILRRVAVLGGISLSMRGLR